MGLATMEPPLGLELHYWAWIIGGVFAVPALAISFQIIWAHLSHYTSPIIQRYMVRIVLMIPIYVIDSYASLLFKDLALYLNVGRDCYEAYVLYMFFRLLIELAGGDEALIEQLEQMPQMKYSMPLCCFHIKPGRIFLHRCRQMILQYAVLKPMLAITTFATELTHTYNEGSFAPTTSYLWITIVYNLSIFIALYFLVLFYEATKEVMKEFKPIHKFLCIKAVIFFAFWQSVLVAALVHVGWVVEAKDDYTIYDVSMGIQNFALCIEMLPIAIAYYYSFGYESFRKAVDTKLFMEKQRPNVLHNFVEVANIKDVVEDTVTAVKLGPQRRVRAGDFFTLDLQSQLNRALYQGWLEKRGEDLAKIWKTRYFVLLEQPQGLVYFKYNPFARNMLEANNVKGRGWISFENVSQQSLLVREKCRFSLATPGRKWHFRCKTEQEREQWIQQLRQVLPESIDVAASANGDATDAGASAGGAGAVEMVELETVEPSDDGLSDSRDL